MKLRIKELCKEKGLTLQQVAECMGVNRVSLSNSINGNPTIGTLEKIATALNVDITELFAKRDGFIAFVRNHGDTHTFDTPAALIEYADGLKGETGPEAPAAPSVSTAPDLFEDPIFR